MKRGEEQRGQERRCCKQGFIYMEVEMESLRVKEALKTEYREDHGRVEAQP